jgi:DNA invertase Pin-like site-specific DNA recombinase
MVSVGYVRVSSATQEFDLQIDALKHVGCERIFEDNGISDRNDFLPGLGELLRYLRNGDVLTVYRLDRLGQSLPDLLMLLTDLDRRGVGFRSVAEALDTTEPTGRLVFDIVAALGQCEQDLTMERNKRVSVEAPRVRRGGRPRSVTVEKLAKAQELLADRRLTTAEVASQLKISRSALYAALAVDRQRLFSEPPPPTKAAAE